jgi:teichuronic acid biosynthesis glycosyltransferase TuaC
MKVVLISNAFPNRNERMRGVFTFQIAKALQKQCRIEVIAPLPWLPRFMKKKLSARFAHATVPSTEFIDGLKVYHPRYLVIPKILGFMHAVFMFLPLLRMVRRLDGAEKIDVINTHWIYPEGVASTWVAKILGKPIVLTALGCDINLYGKMLLRKVQIAGALRNANAVTAVCDSIKDNILDLGLNYGRISVIPNGVDTNLFRIMDRKTARHTLGLPDDRPIVITVGSQDEVKGTKYLVEAFAHMTKRLDITPLLVLIGDGPLRESLVRQANGLGLTKDIVFAGTRPHDEIPLWMNAADVFCLPSIREGHPNVVIEALACGTPVVGTAVGAVPEIIGPSLGRVAVKANSLDLSRCLIEVLNSEWKTQEIRSSVVQYSWDDCGLRYLNILRPLAESLCA